MVTVMVSCDCYGYCDVDDDDVDDGYVDYAANCDCDDNDDDVGYDCCVDDNTTYILVVMAMGMVIFMVIVYSDCDFYGYGYGYIHGTIQCDAYGDGDYTCLRLRR